MPYYLVTFTYGLIELQEWDTLMDFELDDLENLWYKPLPKSII